MSAASQPCGRGCEARRQRSASAPQSSHRPAARASQISRQIDSSLSSGARPSRPRRSASASSMPPRLAVRRAALDPAADRVALARSPRRAPGRSARRWRAPPGSASARPSRDCGSAAARFDHLGARIGDQRRGGGIVEHGELAGHVRLEGKLVQQALAEGVDRLDLQPARRLQRPGEEPPRARASRRRVGARPCSSSIVARRARRPASIVHSPSVSKTRRAISAAAILVKVRQRIAAGSAPASSRRMTRCVSTCVLPEPALAMTQAEDARIRRLALDARACGRSRRGAHGADQSGRRLLLGRDPFGDARQMVVVADKGAARLRDFVATDIPSRARRNARRAR